MAEEEFEIDVYGDAEGGQDQDQGAEEYSQNDTRHEDHHEEQNQEMDGGEQDSAANTYDDHGMDDQNDDQAAPQQGVKRKQEEADDRPVDPGATNALLVSEMQWWVTEDEIRGWVNTASSEGELKDITFSEHKVNGKSKGQAYLEFESQQAATAAKRYIDGLQSGEGGSNQQRRPSVAFHNAHVNPFKTLPKDAPQRQNRDSQGRGGSVAPHFHNGPSVNSFQGGQPGGGFQGNFRGNRGGYNRGGMRGGFGNNNYGGPNMNGFNGNMGFNNPMGGGGFNRGGMGGFNRGGPNMRARGGMNMMGAAPMMGNPMGMGGMMPGMNMMGGGMGMGFNGMPGGQFNPGFFGNNQGGGNYGGNNNSGGGDWGNPHGVKRARGE